MLTTTGMGLVSVLLLLSTSCIRTDALEESPLRGRNLLETLPWTAPNLNVGVDGLDQVLPAIDTTGAGTVKISVDLSNTGSLEDSSTQENKRDAVQAFYRVDSGPEVLWLDADGANFSPQESVLVPAGAQLTLRVKGKTSYAGEVYQFRNFKVTKDGASAAAPVSNPVPVPVSNPVPAAGCDSIMAGNNMDFGPNGLEEFQSFDTSRLGRVEVEFELSHKGNLESSGAGIDFLQVYYKVDNGAYKVRARTAVAYLENNS